ncbi:hypothetical protein CEXT_452051, partial [Caerostris extrusa]
KIKLFKNKIFKNRNEVSLPVKCRDRMSAFRVLASNHDASRGLNDSIPTWWVAVHPGLREMNMTLVQSHCLP